MRRAGFPVVAALALAAAFALAPGHHPRYSAGHYGDNATMAATWKSLADRASLLLNGHEHNYQRFRPIRGLVEIVAGSGGHAANPVGADRRLAFADGASTGAIRIKLRGRTAALRFVGVDGRTLDSSTVRCRR